MNKRYIDFVPVDRRGAVKSLPVAPKKPVVKKPVVKKPVANKPAEKPAEKPIIRRAEPVTTFSRNAASKVAHKTSTRRTVQEVPLEEMFAERVEPAGVSKGSRAATLGVIEDYRPKFVQAEVKKRPLGTKPVVKSVVKPVAKTTGGAKVTAKTVPVGAMRANFINVGKVEKRPLSKNVYTKRAVASEMPKVKAKEESKKPVVIITKPEKDSKVGLVVAVILTIILGAAAGTVAFLLLPK